MYASADAIIRRGVREVLTPREDLHLDEWCDRYAVLPSGGTASARAGRWDTDNTPYLREILRACLDPEVREIAVWKSAQTGATVGLGVNYALYQIEHRNPLLIVYPTEDKGEQINKDKLIPAVEECPRTAALIKRRREVKQREIRISGVPIWFGFTKSSASLRGDSVARAYGDEIDAFDRTVNDPLTQIRSRQETYHDAFLLKTSTPEAEDAGIIHEYNTADVQWKFMVPCPFSGRYFELFEFDQLGWFGGLDTTPERAAANCWVISPFAPKGETWKIKEHLKRWMVVNGVWVTQGEGVESDGSILATLDPATGRELGLDGCPEFKNCSRLTGDFFRDARQEPDRRRRLARLSPERADPLRERLGLRIVGNRVRGRLHGYRFNSLVSLISARGWAGLVHDWVSTKGKPEPTWHKERLGKVPGGKSERLEVSHLRTLCLGRENGYHEHGEIPSFAIATFAGVDCQLRRIVINVWGFGYGGHDQALCTTVVVPRNPDLKFADCVKPIRELALAVQGTSNRLSPHGWLIDSGHFRDEVYALCKHLRAQGMRTWPCKGVDRLQHNVAVRTTVVSYNRLPDGSREKRPDPIELVLVNDEVMSEQLVDRLSPIPSLGEIRSKNDEQTVREELMLAGRCVLPGYDGWVDADGKHIADEVLAELTNVQRITVGLGSGRSGKDGRGQRREVFRPLAEHRPNDHFDASKYAKACAHVFQIERWTKGAMNAPHAARRGRRQVGQAHI